MAGKSRPGARRRRLSLHRPFLYTTVFAPGSAIGVAVADKPTGPFVDALGGPLVRMNNCIDPTVFIEDDGQAYFYWGNPELWYVKLNKDMISTAGEIVQDPKSCRPLAPCILSQP